MMHDNVIMRTIIDLPEEQVQELAALCKSQHISRAEAVRRALATMLASEKSQHRETTFGTWKKRPIDSRQLVEKLRQDWDS